MTNQRVSENDLARLSMWYEDLVPLKKISKRLDIPQPLLRYHLRKLGVLKPEKERIQEYLKLASKLIDITEMAGWLGLKVETVQKLIDQIALNNVVETDVETLSLDPTTFKSRLLIGPNRIAYNNRQLKAYGNCAASSAEIRNRMGDTPIKFREWLRRNEQHG